MFPRGLNNIMWYEFMFHGVKVRESTKQHNRKVAERMEDEHRERLALGTLNLEPVRKPIRFDAAVADWMELKKAEWKPKIVHGVKVIEKGNAYQMHKNSLLQLLPYFGSLMLTDINADVIRKYRNIRLEMKSKNTNTPISNRTVNIEMGTVRQVLIHHKLWNKIKEGSNLKRLKERKDVGRFLTNDECERLLEAAKVSPSMAIYPAILLSIYTGIRQNELKNLKWGDINKEIKMLHVGESKSHGGENRRVNLADVALQLLDEWRKNFPTAKDKHYVFPSQLYTWTGRKGVRGGTAIPYKTLLDTRTESLNTAWRKVKQVAKVECRWHDLRHTCASKVAAGGASAKTLLLLFGWMSEKMLDIYVHIAEQAKQNAMSVIDDWKINQGSKPETIVTIQ